MQNSAFILAAALSMAMAGSYFSQSNTMPDNSASPFYHYDPTTPGYETKRTSHPAYFGAEPDAHGKPVRAQHTTRNH